MSKVPDVMLRLMSEDGDPDIASEIIQEALHEPFEARHVEGAVFHADVDVVGLCANLLDAVLV